MYRGDKIARIVRSIAVKRDLYDIWKNEAESRGISMNRLVEELLEQHLEVKRGKRGRKRGIRKVKRKIKRGKRGRKRGKRGIRK